MLAILSTLPSYTPLVTFDGAAGTTHTFTVENDPVMGGLSTSKWQLTKDSSGTPVGQFSGVCRIVPSLKAPGFVFALTESPVKAQFPDVSAEEGLVLKMANVDGNVTSYKIAFCDSRINPYKCQFGTFKAGLTLSPSSETKVETVFLPWSKFSDKWSAATGAHTAEDPPKAKSLASITQFQMWVEGVAGPFAVNLYEVGAGKATDANATLVEQA